MRRKHAKKVNPRRIPLAKREIDTDAILEEATKDDMYHAWLLAMNALIDQELIAFEEMQDLTDGVNDVINHSSDLSDGAMGRAEKLMGIPRPYQRLNKDKVSSAFDLEAFKRKVGKLAIHTALCVLCIGLESTGRFTTGELRSIFFSVDLTLAELERGITSYTVLEKRLASYGVTLERVNDDLHNAKVGSPI